MIVPQSCFVVISLCICSIFTSSVTASPSPPACTVNCTLINLEASGCQLANSRQCLCTNNTLLYNLALCVLENCNFADQIVAAEILQNDLCAGAPQESRSAEILWVGIIVAAFTFPFIILRLISRIWVTKKLWWDDWAVIFATAFMIPNTSIVIYSAYHGFGKHFWDVPVRSLLRLGKLYYVASINYAVIQNFAKFSILLLYLRIFPGDRFRLVLKITMGWMACNATSFVIAVVFQCVPLQAIWDHNIPGRCLNMNTLTITGAAFSIVEDIFIMILPISELKGLNLTLHKRIALCFMFAIGSFACITSMVRLKFIKHYGYTLDATWNSTDVLIWSGIEIYTAIICSCLLCIRPLLKQCFPSLFPSTRAPESRERSITNPNWAHKLEIAALKLSSNIKGSKGGSQILDDEESGWNVAEAELGKWKSGERERKEGAWMELGETPKRKMPNDGVGDHGCE